MVVAVASGKGGTGKTMVATNLALSLQTDKRVQILDCDVEEPNTAIFIKPNIQNREEITVSIPEVNQDLCTQCKRCAQICAFHAILVLGKQVLVFPELCHACGGCMLFCPTGAITEKLQPIGMIEEGQIDNIAFIQGRLNPGNTLTPALIKAVRQKNKDLDAVIIDAPPGTSCSVIASVSGADFCVLVTEPTPFGLNDLKLAVKAMRILDIPFGVVINRADSNNGIIREYCMKENIPVLLSIPFHRQYAEYFARGVPLVKAFPEWKQSFRKLWTYIEERIVYERDSNNQR